VGPAHARQEAVLDSLTKLDVPFDILALESTPHVDRYTDPRTRVFRAWMPGQSLDRIMSRPDGNYNHLWIFGTDVLARVCNTFDDIRAKIDISIMCYTQGIGYSSLSDFPVGEVRPSDNDNRLLMASHEFGATLDVDWWLTDSEMDYALVSKMGFGDVKLIDANKGEDDFTRFITVKLCLKPIYSS
jgi:hypothetical protein